MTAQLNLLFRQAARPTTKLHSLVNDLTTDINKKLISQSFWKKQANAYEERKFNDGQPCDISGEQSCMTLCCPGQTLLLILPLEFLREIPLLPEKKYRNLPNSMKLRRLNLSIQTSNLCDI